MGQVHVRCKQSQVFNSVCLMNSNSSNAHAAPSLCFLVPCRLPTNDPTWGKFMSDASKLKRSTVSFAAAAALLPPTVSTQSYGNAGAKIASQGLSQCKGRCIGGLCSVDHSILHCCIAREHYLQMRRGKDMHCRASSVTLPFTDLCCYSSKLQDT
jgi:hypothetical protein